MPGVTRFTGTLCNKRAIALNLPRSHTAPSMLRCMRNTPSSDCPPRCRFLCTKKAPPSAEDEERMRLI